MIWFVILLLALLFAPALAHADGDLVYIEPPPETATEPEPYDLVVRVDVTRVTETGHGSGFILDDHRVVTAAHVVRGASRITIVLSDGQERPGALMVLDNYADVAIIRVNVPLERQSTLLCAAPPVGASLRVTGYPQDYGRVTTRGYVASAAGAILELSNAYIADIGIGMGMSGGPALDRAGRVVGIGVAYVGPDYATSLAFIVAPAEICRLAGVKDGQ